MSLKSDSSTTSLAPISQQSLRWPGIAAELVGIASVKGLGAILREDFGLLTPFTAMKLEVVGRLRSTCQFPGMKPMEEDFERFRLRNRHSPLTGKARARHPSFPTE